jgi:general secretion pathway protein G
MQTRDRPTPGPEARRSRQNATPERVPHPSGFTLIELMIAIAVLAALTAIAIPSYQGYVERARRSQAAADLSTLAIAIERYYTNHFTYPPNLAAVGAGLPALDPWGNPYRYLAIDVVPPPNTGAVRRDKNLNPLNSDYDLYSTGPDGQTQNQLTASKARDDIVRAGNGGYIGPASEH